MNEAQSGAPQGHSTPQVAEAALKSTTSPISQSPTTREPAPSTTPSQSKQEDTLTKVFQFLSTATPGTLGGIAAGLAAITYFVLGQLGLLLIGAFAGITLFVAWEGRNPDVSRAVRGEKGYDFLQRLYDHKGSSDAAKSMKDDEQHAAPEMLAQSFDDFQPETRWALQELVNAVIRDYVDWWYAPIVPTDRSFALSCRKVLMSFILAVSNQLSRKRPADAFVDFVTHSCSIIIVFLSQMAAALAELPSDSNSTAVDAIHRYLSSQEDSPLSNLLNQQQQSTKFKMVAEDLLDFLERPSRECDPVRIFLREILSTIILEGTLQTCSKPEWINGWIVYLLEAGETDLSQAIDEAIENQKAFGDVDGNVGNIALAKGNRNSYEMDRARRKEQTHKKKLSKADEEMERAMEEMKKLNEMIAEAERSKTTQPANKDGSSESAAAVLLKDAFETNAKDLDLKVDQLPNGSPATNIHDLSAGPDETKSRGSSIDKPKSTDEPREEPLHSPITPRSTMDLSSRNSSPPQAEPPAPTHFTSFDQLVPQGREDPDESEAQRPPPLSLHNASITVHDDAVSDKGQLRGKPTWEYLLQIEPAASQHPGWMIMKTYVQFEALHESLRRLATISGATAFLEAHSALPSWKIHTRSSLRGEIERYMRAACAEKPLADSEAMKRFLDKAQETRIANKGFSFESVGKGMLGAIQNAPKGALGGSKVVVDGVTGVFGNIGLGSRKSTSSSLQEKQTASPQPAGIPRPLSLTTLPRMDSSNSVTGSGMSRDSIDSQRSSIISVQPGKMAPMDRRPSYQVDVDQENLQPTRSDRWDRNSVSGASSRVHSRASSMAAARRSPLASPSDTSLAGMKLPPPPNEITDDYESPGVTRHSTDGNPRLLSPTAITNGQGAAQLKNPFDKSPQGNRARRRLKQHVPLSEQETRVAVELLFAVINELYTLSSAWNIRRTLLTAAKSFLLRPGNPSLTSIQSLIQDSVIDANTSDDGIATHLRKLRENSLPTEEEREAWPAELTAEEKEELRAKARKLFIQSSVPAALMGIMGQSATTEALGRVFDCLQIEEVARGLFFGILLQAVRVITH
jgi:hypothetical protein